MPDQPKLVLRKSLDPLSFSGIMVNLAEPLGNLTFPVVWHTCVKTRQVRETIGFCATQRDHWGFSQVPEFIELFQNRGVLGISSYS